MGKTLCCEGYKPAILKRKKKKKERNSPSISEQHIRVSRAERTHRPKETLRFLFLEQDLIPNWGLWAQTQDSGSRGYRVVLGRGVGG